LIYFLLCPHNTPLAPSDRRATGWIKIDGRENRGEERVEERNKKRQERERGEKTGRREEEERKKAR